MRPLDIVLTEFNVSNANQSFASIFIPKNTWAFWKRLLVYIDFELELFPPNPGAGRRYNEGYNLQGLGYMPRSANEPIANGSTYTRYIIQRQFMLHEGFEVWEENWNTVGITTLNQAQGIDHRLQVTTGLATYDPTSDGYLEFLLSDTNAGGNDHVRVRDAQAFIQAPLNLNRFPR